jgi:nitroreductase
MDFEQLIQARYSVRAYKPDPVGEHELRKVLEAARLAPTAANRQPFQLIVVHTRGREQELRRIYKREWFVQAPLVIGACGLPGGAWTRADKKNYAAVDVAIVMDHVVLQATDLGLGTCWVGAFDVAEAREILGLPAEVEPIAFTPLGYPADTPKAKERKPLEALVRYERW